MHHMYKYAFHCTISIGGRDKQAVKGKVAEQRSEKAALQCQGYIQPCNNLTQLLILPLKQELQ